VQTRKLRLTENIGSPQLVIFYEVRGCGLFNKSTCLVEQRQPPALVVRSFRNKRVRHFTFIIEASNRLSIEIWQKR